MLNINEIFYSVQGEGLRAGMPCVFVRLQGCKLRCVWCDTPYALDKRTPEQQMNVDELLERIKQYRCAFVEFTGGEPLEQPEILQVMTQLCDEGYTVAVETGGHMDITVVDPRVIRIVDVKCPGSMMTKHNRLENLDHLSRHDEVKFVIASRTDYEWAVDIVRRYALPEKIDTILFSPAFGLLPYLDLVQWILEDALPVRFQIQLHKHIWSPDTRGV
ncbi:MAG: radical SAM protein [Bradyrhizobiaceae bacterium]|nr:radical SAM protein [Bradyrhizobiaceae bacterium]